MDDRVPIPLFQQITTALNIMYTMDLVIRGQLRPELLKYSLEQLTQSGDWRKLGSRLKTSKQHGYELHIPKAFSVDRPAFQWHEQRVKSTAADAGVILPRTQNVSFHPSLKSILGQYRPSAIPSTVKELLSNPKRADESILSVAVVVFDDTTLISLTLPHVFTDAMGMSNIFSAWATVLSGQHEDLPPLLGFRDDPLRDVHGEYGSDIPPGSRVRVVSALGLTRFYAKYVPEIVRYKEETRIVFLPQAKLDAVKAAAERELKAQGKDGWVSTADVVSAVLMKLANLFEHPKDPRLFSLGFSANARSRVPELQSPEGFIGCAVLSHNTAPTPGAEIQRASLAQLALLHRAAVQQLDAPSEVAANISTLRLAYKLKRMPINNKLRGTGYYVTNWCAGSFTALDFSAALVAAGDGSDGRVIFVAGDAFPPGGERRNWAIVFAKDGEAIPPQERGVWFETGFSVHKWPKVEEYLASL